jgi:hypothetical protein
MVEGVLPFYRNESNKMDGTNFCLLMGRNTVKMMGKLFLVAGLVAMMAGCVQMDMNYDIKKDGSGTLVMSMALSDVVYEAIAIQAGDDDLAILGSVMDMDKKAMEKAIKGHGVKVKKLEKKDIDGRETTIIALDFESLEGLSFALNALGMGGGGGTAIVDAGEGNYAYRPYEYAFPEEDDAGEEEDEDLMGGMEDMDMETMEKQMEIMGKMRMAMGELDISMEITVPGDIVTSNAPIVEGRTSIWKINATSMMSGETDMEPNIVFSSKGLKLEPMK